MQKVGDRNYTSRIIKASALLPDTKAMLVGYIYYGLLFGLSNRGNLFCINAQTGRTAWTDTIQRDRGGFAAILEASSVILALPSNSELSKLPNSVPG